MDRVRHAVRVDGAELEVHDSGSGDPLLLIQTALDPAALTPLADETLIASRFRIIDLRRRGYGMSTPVTGPGSIARDAADCHAVLRALDAEPAHVLGTSYSGAVTLELAASAPEVVRTLTVIEPPPANVAAGDEFRTANERICATFREQGVTLALEEFSRALGAPSWLAERETAAPEVVRRVERDATAFFISDAPALIGWRFDASRAALVATPLLYVGGRESGPWFQQVHTWVRESFPHCEHHILAGAGHSLATTHSAVVALLLADFLTRHRD